MSFWKRPKMLNSPQSFPSEVEILPGKRPRSVPAPAVHSCPRRSHPPFTPSQAQISLYSCLDGFEGKRACWFPDTQFFGDSGGEGVRLGRAGRGRGKGAMCGCL